MKMLIFRLYTVIFSERRSVINHMNCSIPFIVHAIKTEVFYLMFDSFGFSATGLDDSIKPTKPVVSLMPAFCLNCFKNIIAISGNHNGDDNQEKGTDETIPFFERHFTSDNASCNIEDGHQDSEFEDEISLSDKNN